MCCNVLKNLQGCTVSKLRRKKTYCHCLGFLISHLLIYTAFQNIMFYLRDLLLSEMSKIIDVFNRIVIQVLVYLLSAFPSLVCYIPRFNFLLLELHNC